VQDAFWREKFRQDPDTDTLLQGLSVYALHDENRMIFHLGFPGSSAGRHLETSGWFSGSFGIRILRADISRQKNGLWGSQYIVFSIQPDQAEGKGSIVPKVIEIK